MVPYALGYPVFVIEKNHFYNTITIYQAIGYVKYLCHLQTLVTGNDY